MENGGVKNPKNSTTHEEQRPLIRSVFSLKNKKRIREVEKVEECFILEFDPNESASKPSSLSKFEDDEDNDAPDIRVIAQHGKVACRDFPHSRHLCVQYPFSKTPHETHCKLCHCYVCDIAAPCPEWSDHCHAVHKRFSEWWYFRRQRRRQYIDSDSDDYFE